MLLLSSLLSCIPLYILLSSLAIPATSNSPRTLTLINQCPDDYWFLPVAGAAPFSSPQLTFCASDADCIDGSRCLLPTPALCYWAVPTPSPATFHLTPSSTSSLTFPFVDNGHDIHWSGNLQFCRLGSCGPFPPPATPGQCDAQGCGVYAGPGNSVEFTWSKTGTDYYDVSNIAGVNVPLSFGPLAPVTPPSPAHPYTCGTPGATDGSYPSSWAFTAPSVFHQWVPGGGWACEADGECGEGEVCGLSHIVDREPRWQLQCGSLIGYWTQNSACAMGVDAPNSPFDCSAAVDVLTRCNGGIGSCYQPGAGPDCCGCVEWQEVLGVGMVPVETASCVSRNEQWRERVLPELKWLKAGAPSAYVYPYDDMSSTFICSQKEGHLNHVDYQVTLCP